MRFYLETGMKYPDKFQGSVIYDEDKENRYLFHNCRFIEGLSEDVDVMILKDGKEDISKLKSGGLIMVLECMDYISFKDFKNFEIREGRFNGIKN